MKRVLMFMMLLGLHTMHSRFHSVHSTSEFEKLVDAYAYSMVCFAPSKQFADQDLDQNEKRVIQDTFRDLKNMIRAASQQKDFKEYLPKDVGFLLVDVTSKKIQDTIELYHIGMQPQCMVFDNGQAEHGSKIMRPASTKDLLMVLEKIGGDDLQDLLDDRKQEISEQRQERIAAYYAYGASYPYWGYGPYWYNYPSWYGRPGVGWYIGF